MKLPAHGLIPLTLLLFLGVGLALALGCSAEPAPETAQDSTPVPEPTPVPGSGPWVLGEVIEITRPDVSLAVYTSGSVQPAGVAGNGNQTQLFLTCTVEGIEASVWWGFQGITGGTPQHSLETTYWVDDNDIVRIMAQYWPKSNGLVMSGHKRLVEEMAQGRKFFIEVSNLDHETLRAEFDLRGLNQVLDQLPCWPAP